MSYQGAPAGAEPLASFPIAIANGTALSAAVALGGNAPIRIAMPAAWTAAALTFQVSTDGVAFADLYKTDGTEYSVTAAAGHAIDLNGQDFFGVAYLKLRSGTGGVPVNQGADRVVTLTARPIA